MLARSMRMFAVGSRVQSRAFHPQSSAAAKGIFGKLFGRDKKESPAESAAPADEAAARPDDAHSDEAAARAAESMQQHFDDYDERPPLVPKFPQRNYTPARLEQRLQRVLRESQVPLAGDWKQTSIAEKSVKLKVLSGVIMHMKLPVSNRVLNNVRTVGDLLAELSEKPPSKDAGHPVAAYYAERADELPPNLKFEPFARGTRKLHARQ
ncbi:hypothetical protein IWW55_002623 [Coemansia sp. RSA 2706]|nr:hypothetical protein LPJ63_000133 [Coemansia sp. RSA 2711]KAJ2304034.1 hypothetical protein IWW55_002623 [Coemansia sp. RSA 2706]KAJ2309143.1 hypothetical protein IWW54_003894 [Coemansia sp. RSA 2705]KAJ2316517.1 hypothetical protein IWW52_003608 [Coemansia sp. RSA 2704]KAJ2326333.1 hypothetical protein IWW51_002329 [Coemansia sp. RSA 2702]KAJ2729380.1 hypothetical protein H4R23_003490 [Coemansia sp. Cherry 401B]